MLNRAMVANPIGAITIAFTALRSALTYYDRNNEESIRLEREKTEVMNTLKTSNEKTLRTVQKLQHSNIKIEHPFTTRETRFT